MLIFAEFDYMKILYHGCEYICRKDNVHRHNCKSDLLT